MTDRDRRDELERESGGPLTSRPLPEIRADLDAAEARVTALVAALDKIHAGLETVKCAHRAS